VASAPQVAAQAIRDAIITAKFKAGERLVEGKLAEDLGIGQPTLREALKEPLMAETADEIVRAMYSDFGVPPDAEISLGPRYPSRGLIRRATEQNLICSRSPPFFRRSFAQVRRRS